MTFDVTKAYETISEDYVVQGDRVFCWSESHCDYEEAWWLLPGADPSARASILAQRPLPASHAHLAEGHGHGR